MIQITAETDGAFETGAIAKGYIHDGHARTDTV